MVPIGSRTTEFAADPSDVKDRLKREIATSDVYDFDEESMSCWYRDWLMLFKYNWEVSEVEEGTQVTETRACNGAGLIGAILPVAVTAFVYTLAILLPATTALSFADIFDPNRSIVVNLGILNVTFLLSMTYFIKFRESPKPLEEIRHEATASRARSLVYTIALGAMIAIAPFIVLAILHFEETVDVLVDSPGLATVIGVLLWSVPVLVFIGYWRDDVERLHCRHGRIESLDDWISNEHGAEGAISERSRYGEGVGAISSAHELTNRFRTIEAKFENTREDFLLEEVRKAADRVGVNIDPELKQATEDEVIGRGETSRFSIPALYEWKIKKRSRPDSEFRSDFLVQETIYFSGFLPLILSFLFLSVGVILLVNAGYLPALVGLNFLPVVLLSGSAVALLSAVFKSGLDLNQTSFEIIHGNSAIRRPVLLAGGPAILGLFVFRNGPQWVLLACAIALFGVMLLTLFGFDQIATPLERSQLPQQVPPPIVSYLGAMAIIGSANITLVFTEGIQNEPLADWAIGIFGILAISGTPYQFNQCAAETELSKAVFESDIGEYGASPLQRWLGFGVAVTLSLVVFATSLLAASIVIARFGGFGSGQALLYSLPFLAPALFLLGGVLYQSLNFYRTLGRLFTESAVIDPAEYGISEKFGDVEIRLHNGSLSPKAVSTFRHRAIFVSEELISLLEEDELNAFIAHEYAHVGEYNDGYITFFATLIGSIVLTGRNIVLAAADFPSREARADEYAAETVSEKALAGGLDKVRTQALSDRTGEAVQGIAAGFEAPGELTTGRIAQLTNGFHLYYGAYTVTSAHPRIEDRIYRYSSE